MPKKSSHKVKKARRSQKNGGYYLKLTLLSVISCVVVFVAGNYYIKPHVPCANSKTCVSDLSLHIDNNATGTFEGHTFVPPKIDIVHDFGQNAVLGTSTPAGDKHIYVDLSAQRLYAYQGDQLFMQSYISSGKWDPTPIGNFHIWEKLRATRMAGGTGADAYDLPNVPYVMYFYQDFGLHGAYWHNNFGHPMSHGCINERLVDAQELYGWAEVGTAVSTCNSFTGPNNCIQNNPIND